MPMSNFKAVVRCYLYTTDDHYGSYVHVSLTKSIALRHALVLQVSHHLDGLQSEAGLH